MKIKKSVISVVVMIAMIFTSLGSTLVSAAGPDATEALKRAQLLDVLDSSVTDVNSVVTRGQFAKALVSADNLTDAAASLAGSTVYPDVASNSELSGYVNILSQKGLLYGTADGYFHAEKPITYAETCTALVKLLGYGDGDVQGTWPSNYISKASDLQLIQKITLKKNDGLPVWAAALMFDRLFATSVKPASGTTTSKIFVDSVNLYSDCVILANSTTSQDLASNAVLTDKGTLYLQDGSAQLDAGATYRLSLDSDNTIKKVYGQVNSALSFIVNSYQDNVVNYSDNNGVVGQMTLPSTIAYYYNGVKTDYSSLNTIVKADQKIVFEYNTNKTGYSYAVIVDALYSDPVIASNFNPASNNIGNISFDAGVPIIKNGKIISKADIQDMDVVYNVTDVDGNNRTIQVFNDRVEGNITSFSVNGALATGIQLDNTNYYYSKDMNTNSVSGLKVGALVTGIQGHDGKIISVKTIDHKLGKLIQGKIVGNSKTSDNLADNQVLVNQGTDAATAYNCLKDIGELSIGTEYSFYADGTTITKINEKINNVEDYAVASVSGSYISYYNDNGPAQTMTLPQVSEYYYHGAKVDYNTAANSIQPYSSIVLGKGSNNTGYAYAVIVDPCYSAPSIYVATNSELLDKFSKTKYDFIIKDGSTVADPANLNVEDVVYFVSDLWNKATYVYVNDTTVSGRITALLPNRITPNTIQINNTSYTLSQYFDKSKLFNNNSILYVNRTITLVLGVDGKVVDMY